MNKVDIEKIKYWKSNADFYRSMVDTFFENAMECGNFDEDRFIDYFYNDILTLDELLEDKKVENCLIELTKEEEFDDGSALYTFDYTEEFVSRMSKSTGIENPTEEDIKKFVKDTLTEAAENTINESNG